MSQENVKPEQIQASVAAALSRLRGDAAPPSDAPDSPPPPAPTPAPAPTGMAPGISGMGVRPDPMRPPANDLRAEPGLRPVPSSAMPSGMGAPVTNEPPAAKEPELPRAMFSRPGPTTNAPTTSTPMTSPMASTPAQPAPQPEPAPTVQRPVSPLSRMMSREVPGVEAAKPVTVEKVVAPTQQPDLLAGLPPPPLGDALTQEDDGGARRRRNRRILMLAAAIVVVAGAFWLFTRGGGDSADAPVISAEMTPEKVKPVDEGGLQVPNQNVQVLDNTEQTAEGETVLPPPEQPVTPPEPTTAEAPQPAEPPAVVDSNSATVVEDIPAVTAPEPATTAEAPAIPAPVAPEPTAEAAQPEAEPAAPAVAATTPETAPEPAVPAQQATAPEPTPEPAPTTTQEAAVTPPPAPAAVGDARVQLAAVKSESAAQAEWAKMQKAHPDLLGNLTLTVQSVDKNGTTFYRIQAGPVADRAAAKQLCASLKGQGQDCIVAK